VAWNDCITRFRGLSYKFVICDMCALLMELHILTMFVLIFNMFFFIFPISFYKCYAYAPALNSTGHVSAKSLYGLDVLVKLFCLYYDIDLNVAMKEWFGHHSYRYHRLLLWAVV